LRFFINDIKKQTVRKKQRSSMSVEVIVVIIGNMRAQKGISLDRYD